MFRWKTDEEIEAIKQQVIEMAVRAVLALDPYVYDEGTVRAAAQVVRESIRRKS
jgi:hypothetical protein